MIEKRFLHLVDCCQINWELESVLMFSYCSFLMSLHSSYCALHTVAEIVLGAVSENDLILWGNIRKQLIVFHQSNTSICICV